MKNETSIPTKNTFKELPYPAFLAYNFKKYNYEIREDNTIIDNTYKDKLIKKYGNNNVIILLNGQVVYNSTNSLQVTADPNHFLAYKKQQAVTETEQINKDHLNSVLNIVVKSDVQQELKIVIAATKDTCHYAKYNFLENAVVNLTEVFEIAKNAKLNYNAEHIVKNDAIVNLAMLQDLNNNADNIFNFNIQVQNNAEITFGYANLNSSNVVNVTKMDLVGKYSKGVIKTINFANKSYSLANLMTIEHKAQETTSLIDNYGIVNDTAELVVDGVGIIQKGNSKSTAEQESRIVNLSDKAKSVANPQLIINEYDVKAGHAAAVGQIDEGQLFYIMSRGLTKQESIKLIIMSNVNDMLAMFTDKKITTKIVKLINKKIM